MTTGGSEDDVSEHTISDSETTDDGTEAGNIFKKFKVEEVVNEKIEDDPFEKNSGAVNSSSILQLLIDWIPLSILSGIA